MQNRNFIIKLAKDLLPGDITLHPLYRSDRLLLINKNKVLTSSLIEIVKKQVPDCFSVLVASSIQEFESFLDTKVYESIEFKNALSKIMKKNNFNDELIDEHLTVDNKLSKDSSKDSSKDVYTLFSNILDISPLWQTLEIFFDSFKLKSRATLAKSELLNVINDTKSIHPALEKIYNYNDTLIIRTVNIMCVSLLVGITLELTIEELIDLSIAALFSNIGFTQMPIEKYNKLLNEEPKKIIKKHLELFARTTVDSLFLRKKSIVYGILDSHEFFNGEGLPYGKKGNEISLFGRILLIANAYEGMLFGAGKAEPLSPTQIINKIIENNKGEFDTQIVKTFLHRTTFFKINQNIILENEEKAKIVGFSDFVNNPHLPIVKLNNGEIKDLLL